MRDSVVITVAGLSAEEYALRIKRWVLLAYWHHSISGHDSSELRSHFGTPARGCVAKLSETMPDVLVAAAHSTHWLDLELHCGL